ncbi:MAG: nucleotidyltransferase family protein [Thermosynechococcus sp.]|uniref:nucleotidyltransferase family protein n=1 Tax=Thermosynechococcus sp. TaxID=2814275 RepID=UPI003919EB08
MMDGLTPEKRKAIIDTLTANPKVERIVLFGSRAIGAFRTTSDIDIALFGENLTLSDQAALAEAIAELPIAQRVDLLLYHDIENADLREQIENHGVEWFARNKLITAEGTERDRLKDRQKICRHYLDTGNGSHLPHYRH